MSLDFQKRLLQNILHPEYQKTKDVQGMKNAIIEYMTKYTGYAGRPFRLDPGLNIYRAVLNREKGKPVEFLRPHTDRLFAPPVELAKKGRCGDHGERVLYCCEHPLVSVAELNGLTFGDVVTFLTFNIHREWAPVCFVNPTPLTLKHSQFNSFISQYFVNNPRDLVFQMIDEQFGFEYGRIIADGDDHLYNSTIAWKHLCFERSDARCLIYPAVTSDLFLANLAFDPDFAKRVLRPIEVNRYRFLEVDTANGRFKIQLEHQAKINDYGDFKLEPIESLPEYVTYWDQGGNPFGTPRKH